MGTPDYIAPEQARESHNVDIRADIYSLGCTFYFLLTGAVPFATGSLIQKLYKHQFDDPTAVESVRPEVPHYVGDIVRKMMAKAPGDRFQTPAELVDACAPSKRANQSPSPPHRPVRRQTVEPGPVSGIATQAGSEWNRH